MHLSIFYQLVDLHRTTVLRMFQPLTMSGDDGDDFSATYVSVFVASDLQPYQCGGWNRMPSSLGFLKEFCVFSHSLHLAYIYSTFSR